MKTQSCSVKIIRPKSQPFYICARCLALAVATLYSYSPKQSAVESLQGTLQVIFENRVQCSTLVNQMQPCGSGLCCSYLEYAPEGSNFRARQLRQALAGSKERKSGIGSFVCIRWVG